MIDYSVTNRTVNATLDWLQVIQGGVNLSGGRAVLNLGARKGITRVPMDYILKGPPAQVMSEAIVTDGLFDCETVILIGCDVANQIQMISFSHVQSGYPGSLDWNAFTNGVLGHPNLYAVAESSSMTSHASSALLDTLVANHGVPTANTLIYRSMVGSSAGRSFGINAVGQVGEVDAQLVARVKAAKVDGSMTKAGFLYNSYGGPLRGPFAVKQPK